MHAASLRQLEDHEVLAGTLGSYESVKQQTAEFLRYLAELDRRQLHRAAGYSSAHHFCVQHMRMSEDQAYKCLRAARAGRRFPIVFDMIADGRSNVSAVKLLAPHLTRTHGEALLRDATGMTNEQVRVLLAERFPQPNVPTVMFALATPVVAPASDVNESSCELAVRPVGACDSLQDNGASSAAPEEILSATPVPAITYARVSPLSPASYAFQCTLSADAHAMLREAQDLLGPRVARDDVPQVLELALAALLQQLKRSRKSELLRPVAARVGVQTEAPEPRPESRAAQNDAGRDGAHDPGHSPEHDPRHDPKHNPRHIPAHIRRAVWARDADCCQFVSATGRRCESRSGVEIDHVRPVALGGTSVLANLRLLCRAHNQLEAEARLGRGLMEAKRSRA